MLIGKAIGDIRSARREESLRGLKFPTVCPPDLLEGRKPNTPIVAIDNIDAGVGETVLIVSRSSARTAVRRPDVPVNATIIGIISDKEVSINVLQQR